MMKGISGNELGGGGGFPILDFNFLGEDFPFPRPFLPFVQDGFFLDFILIILEKEEELPLPPLWTSLPEGHRWPGLKETGG